MGGRWGRAEQDLLLFFGRVKWLDHGHIPCLGEQSVPVQLSSKVHASSHAGSLWLCSHACSWALAEEHNGTGDSCSPLRLQSICSDGASRAEVHSMVPPAQIFQSHQWDSADSWSCIKPTDNPSKVPSAWPSILENLHHICAPAWEFSSRITSRRLACFLLFLPDEIWGSHDTKSWSFS